LFAERGVFSELYRSDRPVWTDAVSGPGELPRVAIAVRAGDEVLGSIWAAVEKPLSEERTQALVDAAKLVALYMLHLRAGGDIGRRLRADLLNTALAGGRGARAALGRLGLAEQSVVVLALGIREPDLVAGSMDANASLITERQRITDAFAMHLTAAHPRCATAMFGDVAYGLVPVRRGGADREERAYRIATEFLRRVGDRHRAVIGIGTVAHSADELSYARDSADQVLRVLRSGIGDGRTVARLADVHAESLLLDLRDLVVARGDRPTGAIALLREYDERHHGQLVETLRAWLDAFGDLGAAAAAVHVHPNTFRYRLRRVSEVSGMNLDDPDTRLAAILQLRIVSALANPPAHAIAIEPTG
jgi:hypothetical protein